MEMSLPQEIWGFIISMLSISQRIRAARVCKKWKEIIYVQIHKGATNKPINIGLYLRIVRWFQYGVEPRCISVNSTDDLYYSKINHVACLHDIARWYDTGSISKFYATECPIPFHIGMNRTPISDIELYIELMPDMSVQIDCPAERIYGLKIPAQHKYVIFKLMIQVLGRIGWNGKLS